MRTRGREQESQMIPEPPCGPEWMLVPSAKNVSQERVCGVKRWYFCCYHVEKGAEAQVVWEARRADGSTGLNIGDVNFGAHTIRQGTGVSTWPTPPGIQDSVSWRKWGNLINHRVNGSAIFQALIYSGFSMLHFQGNIYSCHPTSREVNEFESHE